ncbi:N-acetylmuramoyl-L-alanine amidase [Streptohalobacillus salinus]|uniref:N-acetylmuramoyl-L-alanine amidase n=1 Tax=Streptohalobacillus salinus TaxID=621096 RepID=A0A2V3WAT8_9BACI|nr:N-acetylmuramoyl-L-alanine amidase [Streptohalobacillus salinus]PXW91577.1 N-acetylmuramoyl-L-alanine amidase [Streptohalobacillus salinus]
MRYIKPLVILIVFILFMSPLVLTADSIKINADDLRVRSGPGTNFDPIGHVNTGDTFEQLDLEDGWIQINYQGSTGWVHQDFVLSVSDDGANPDEETSSTDDTVIETSKSDSVSFPYETTVELAVIHLRAEPDVFSERIAKLKKKTNVTVIDQVDGEWYHVETDEEVGYVKQAILDLKQTEPIGVSPFVGKTIVIDPGHGGIDVGAISLDDEYESIHTLITANHLKNKLEARGATIRMTRDDDFYYPLTPRATLSNYLKADLFLSLHYNSEPSYPTANGIDTYYRNASRIELANDVHQAILTETGANDRGVASGNYSVLRNNRRPGLLLELGFLSNTQEERLILQRSYQDKLAEGISNGVEKYFSR